MPADPTVGSMRRWIAAGLLALAACGGQERDSRSIGTSDETREPLPVATSDRTRRQLHVVSGHHPEVTCVASGPGTVVVRLRDGSFDPACLRLRGGQPIRFVNHGSERHNVTILEADVSLDLAPGERGSVRLAAGDPLQAFCRFHLWTGMRATITVAADDAG